SPQPLSFALLPLIFGRRRIMGSLVGGVPETQEMLDFSAAKGIRCMIEEIGPGDINSAYDRVLRGEVKYRFVVDCKALRPAMEDLPMPVPAEPRCAAKEGAVPSPGSALFSFSRTIRRGRFTPAPSTPSPAVPTPPTSRPHESPGPYAHCSGAVPRHR